MESESKEEGNSVREEELKSNVEMAKTESETSETVQAGPSGVTPRPDKGKRFFGFDQDPSPDIYKLDVDCFHEIFEYLSLYDLLSVAETSKRFQMVAGDFYRSYYVSKKVIAQQGGVSILYRRSLNCMSRFITSVYFNCNGLKTYRFVGSNCKSLQQIRFGGPLPELGIEYIKGVLDKIECVDLDECFFRNEFYSFLLTHCTELKSLNVRRSMKVRNKPVIIGDNNDWLLRTYPTLEHLELTELYNLDGDELKTFFTQNPNVRTFSTDSHSLWENRETFLACDVTLDKLAVEFTSKDLADSVINLLTQLFDRGFFKRLHVYSSFVSHSHLSTLFALPLAQSLEMLHVRFMELDVCLENVTALGICPAYDIIDLKSLARKLPNLQRVYFYEISTDSILHLIKHLPKLRTIKIFRLAGGTHCKGYYIDLSVYNMERKKLNGARPLTIYVDEYFVMHPQKNYSLVKLGRFEWFNWKELSSKYRHDHLPYY